MQIKDVPFTVTNWGQREKVEFKGESGTSFWQTFAMGNIRVRMVEYSPDFASDHWCPRGHVLLVLEGQLSIKLKDGQVFNLEPGMSFQAADDEVNPHFAWSEKGAKVFIVD